MIDLAGFVRTNLVKPKVVHALPGRMRLSVPGLKQLPPPLLDSLSRLDLTQIGIASVEASPYTGNALIRYDADSIRQEEILSAMTSLALTFLSYKERFMTVPDDRIPLLGQKLQEYVITHRAQLNGKELNLPDDIWQ